ncbi:hypothetical protein F5146DRAFT_996621 [Armillaria mellea]|nr:hypothetical protein F5146DRAFT_996621 [Armillaria mellea]
MVEPISTNLTTEQGFSFCDYGTFEEESQWDDDSHEFLVQPQDESLSSLPDMTKDKPTMSTPLYTEAVDLSPIPMSGFRGARQLFAPEMSYLALLESQDGLFPPSKRHRLCMSHISVPPLPHDKAEYKTLSLLPKHRGSDFAKAKSPGKSKAGLTHKYEQVLARSQPHGEMFLDSSSGDLCPITKVIPPPKTQHQLSEISTQSMGWLLPQKNSTVRGVGGELRPRSPNVDRRANVTEDSDNDSIQDEEYATNSETAYPRNSLKTPMHF